MNQPLSHHLLTMAYQNAWANHRLAKAWSQLSEDELAAPRVSFFPSLGATLNHILTCDWFYVDALERELRGDDPHPDCFVFFQADEPFPHANDLKHDRGPVGRPRNSICQHMHEDTPGTRRNTPAACACCRIFSSTRSIIAGRSTRYSVGLRSSRRSWTSFSVLGSRTCGRKILPSWDGLRR